MRMKHILSAGFGALALGLVATGAQAAPVGGLGGAVDANVTDASLVEKVHWYGHRYGYRPYYYGHYGYKPYSYGHYGYYRPYYRWHKPYGYGHYRHWY